MFHPRTVGVSLLGEQLCIYICEVLWGLVKRRMKGSRGVLVMSSFKNSVFSFYFNILSEL